MATIVLTEEGAPPSAPSAGRVTVYCTGGVLYTLANGGSPVRYLDAGVLTTLGDLLYQGASPTRLAIGTPNQLLRSSAGGVPEWATVSASDVGAVATSLLTTNGDLVYRDGAGAVARLPVGTAGQVLLVSAGTLPEWGAAPTTPVPWTALIGEGGAVTTTDATPTVVVLENAQWQAGGVLYDFEVTALYRDLSAMYSWKVLATVIENGLGSVTLQDAVITPTNPGGPLAIVLSISIAPVATNLLVTATGVGGATIDWYKSGTRKFHPQGQ